MNKRLTFNVGLRDQTLLDLSRIGRHFRSRLDTSGIKEFKDINITKSILNKPLDITLYRLWRNSHSLNYEQNNSHAQ
jgi:hypothetical protein